MACATSGSIWIWCLLHREDVTNTAARREVGDGCSLALSHGDDGDGGGEEVALMELARAELDFARTRGARLNPEFLGVWSYAPDAAGRAALARGAAGAGVAFDPTTPRDAAPYDRRDSSPPPRDERAVTRRRWVDASSFSVGRTVTIA